jgi:hypothetical protein
MSTIFVSVASYRDADCKNTVANVFESAAEPERVYVGICEQNAHEEGEECCQSPSWKDLATYREGLENHVRRVRLHASDARGPTYARYLCASLWQGEEYFLQLDSHMRLVPGWDVKLIDMERRAALQVGNHKVVLSTYAGIMESYDEYLRGAGGTRTTSPRMCQAFFNQEGMISFQGANILENTPDLIPVPFVAGGLLFGRSTPLIRDVPFDPYLDDLFVGEEILLSARLWTSGFDIFCPNENIAFHKFTREREPKFWENLRDDSDATLRVRYILGLLRPTDVPSKRSLIKVDRYGLGKERSLQDYFRFAGIDVESRSVYKNFCAPDVSAQRIRGREWLWVALTCATVFLALLAVALIFLLF